jgi:exosortase/archaeosortase family protein
MLPLVVVAAAHVALAFRTGMVSYEVPAAIGWAGVLLVQRERPLALRSNGIERVAGIALAASGLALALIWSGGYRAPLRLTPLALGAGVLLARHGLSGLRRCTRELILLALPVIVPPPSALRPFLEPQRATLLFSAGILDVLGHHATVAGDVLCIQGGAIRVLSECSGINCMSQLAALALLLVCLFETTGPRRVLAVAAAIAAGFVANCGRLALLVLLSQRNWPAFELWHSATGEARFTLLGLALAALAWWLLLRKPAPAAQPT